MHPTLRCPTLDAEESPADAMAGTEMLYSATVATTIAGEAPTLVMVHMVQPARKEIRDVTKCGLPQITSYTSRLMLDQGLLHQTQSVRHRMHSPDAEGPRKIQPGTGTYVLGLQPPLGVLNLQINPAWLTLLHLLATHHPSSEQHEYTTICLQIGDCQKVQPMPENRELALL